MLAAGVKAQARHRVMVMSSARRPSRHARIMSAICAAVYASPRRGCRRRSSAGNHIYPAPAYATNRLAKKVQQQTMPSGR